MNETDGALTGQYPEIARLLRERLEREVSRYSSLMDEKNEIAERIVSIEMNAAPLLQMIEELKHWLEEFDK